MFFLLIFSSCSRNPNAKNEKKNDNNFIAIPAVKNVFASSAYPLSKEREIAAIPNKISSMPAPTELAENEEENEKDEQNAREKWIENMHRAAPNVNWKQLDANNRYQRYKSSGKYLLKKESIDSGKLSGTWSEKGSKNQAGRIALCDIDTIGGFIYAGSGGGNIFKGKTDGTGWHCLNEALKFPGITMLRILQKDTGNRILVATTDNNFYYSDDDGINWTKSGGLSNAARYGGCAKGIMTNDTTHTIFLLLEEWDYTNWKSIVSVYYSRDKGLNFSKLRSFPDPEFAWTAHYDLWTSYYGSGTVYLERDSAIYAIAKGDTAIKSSGTINWKAKGDEYLTGSELNGKTYLYSMIDTFIYYSADAGKTWKYKNYFHTTPYTKWSFHCSDQNASNLQIGGVNCWLSTDGGNSFSATNDWSDYYKAPDVKLHADNHCVLSFRDSKGAEYSMVGNDGGLYRGNAGITSVTNLSLSGLDVSMYYTVYTNRNNTGICYAGAQDQGFQRALADTAGKALDFDQLISGDYGHIVSSDGGKTLWTVYPTFADYYPDAANSKKEHAWYYNFKNAALWMAPLMADPYDPTIAWLGGGSSSSTGAHMVQLTYVASTQQVTSAEDTFDFSRNKLGQISAIACSPINSDYRYVLTENGGFYSSTDAGQTWTLNKSFTAPAGHYFYGSCILPSTRKLGELWISGSGYSNPAVYVSQNNGKTFKPLATGMPSTLAFQLAADTSEKFIYAATELGPYALNTQEDVWYYLGGTSAPDQTYWTVDFIPGTNTARFGTYGRGIWDFKVDDGSVSGISPAIKSTAELQLFPNPATYEINISIENEKASPAEIIIYDLGGKIIYTEKINAPEGKFSHLIALKNIPSGVYLMQYKNNDSVISKKFVRE